MVLGAPTPALASRERRRQEHRRRDQVVGHRSPARARGPAGDPDPRQARRRRRRRPDACSSCWSAGSRSRRRPWSRSSSRCGQRSAGESMDEPRQIRSYGVVFSLERRLHSIDRFRIPLPYGLPLRSVGYGALILAAVLAARSAPRPRPGGRPPARAGAVCGPPDGRRGPADASARRWPQRGRGGRRLSRRSSPRRASSPAGGSGAGGRSCGWRTSPSPPALRAPSCLRGTITGPCEVLLDADVASRRTAAHDSDSSA